MKVKIMSSLIALILMSGCTEQVAQVADIAHVTKDRGDAYKTAQIQPSLKIPKDINKEESPETYRIP
jgi:uncharacterized lipoprotein